MDYYAILAVTPDATLEDIKIAYRSLVREYHPDKFQTYVQKVWATGKLQDINAAYAVLRDQGKRATYDTERRRARQTIGSDRAIPHETHSVRTEQPKWVAVTIATVILSFYLLSFYLGTAGWLISQIMHEPWPDASVIPVLRYIEHWFLYIPFLTFLFGTAALSMLLVGLMIVGIIVLHFMEALKRATQDPNTVRADLNVRLIMLGILILAALAIYFRVPGGQMLGWIIISIAGLGIPILVAELVTLILYIARMRTVSTQTELLIRADGI